MNSFEQSGKGLKRLLVSTVAVIGLTGVAQGQVVELQGLMDNKDFGGGASFYLPLGNVASGMPFLSIGAGLLGGQKSGEALVGYGQSLGSNTGLRGYAGVGLREGKNNGLFTNAKVGAELVIGGFGLNVSGSVPFGKTRQVSSKGSTGIVFVDPNGQQCDPTGACTPLPPTCSNPLPGQMKHCEGAIAVTNPSYEKALKGFEVGMDYQVQLGNVTLTPSLGYYRYGKNEVTGAKAGLEVSVPLTSQLSLNVGAGGNKEFKGDNKGVSGFGSLGISYHFGATPVSRVSSLERRFAQAPNRNQRTVTTHIQEGKTTIYRNQPSPGGTGNGITIDPPMFGIKWDHNSRGHYVRDIWLVDATNASQLDDLVGMASEDSIILVDGSKGEVKLDNTVEFKSAGVGVVGGGSRLNLLATRDGGKTFTSVTYSVSGNRPTISQADDTKDVFYANGVENPIIFGLDMKGGNNGVEFISANQARITQVNGRSAIDKGFSFVKSSDAILVGVSSLASGQDGFYFEDSRQALLLEVKSIADKRNGFYFLRSDDAVLSNIYSSAKRIGIYFEQSHYAFLVGIDTTQNFAGITFQDSNNATLSDVHVDDIALTGLRFDHSNNATLSSVHVYNVGDGLVFTYSNNATLSDVHVDVAGFWGLSFTHSSNNATLSSVHVYDAYSGLVFDDSDYATLDQVNLSKIGKDGIEFIRSSHAKVTNVKIVEVDYTGLWVLNGNDIQLDTISIEGTNLSSVGIELIEAGTVGQEVSFKNVSVRDVNYGYQFDKDSAVKDLGSNVALFATHICDGVNDATGSVLVNGIDKCQ